eukprot:1156988-Pelagomonas_calceolata.AAC.7
MMRRWTSEMSNSKLLSEGYGSRKNKVGYRTVWVQNWQKQSWRRLAHAPSVTVGIARNSGAWFWYTYDAYSGEGGHTGCSRVFKSWKRSAAVTTNAAAGSTLVFEPRFQGANQERYTAILVLAC